MLKNKDEILTGVAILILFLTSMINWTTGSWLILVAVIFLLIAWYVRKK